MVCNDVIIVLDILKKNNYNQRITRWAKRCASSKGPFDLGAEWAMLFQIFAVYVTAYLPQSATSEITETTAKPKQNIVKTISMAIYKLLSFLSIPKRFHRISLTVGRRSDDYTCIPELSRSF